MSSVRFASLVSALQLPSVREGVLAETGGRCAARPALAVGGTARLGHLSIRSVRSRGVFESPNCCLCNL